jgi:hypothetical protein
MNNIFITIIFLFVINPLFSQTNLICNPSFEEVNQVVKNKLCNSEILYSSHLTYDELVPSLFGCWHLKPLSTNGGLSNSSVIGGLVYGIVPGLVATYQGTENVSGLPRAGGPNDSEVTPLPDGTLKAYMPNEGNSGLTLTNNIANNLSGFDLSPPSSLFGENVQPASGSNYLALFDFFNPKYKARPIIYQRLKYPVVKGVTYTFSFEYAKMNLLGYLKSNENWDEIKNGKLKIWLTDSDFGNKQPLAKIDIEDNNWNFYIDNEKADNNSTTILIEYDPIGENIFGNSKIAGVFIDNLKLYEACETNENMCNNANYRRDMLDADLQLVNLESPLAFPDPEDNSNDPGILKSIRAVGLENVKHFEMYIKNPAGNTIRNIVMDYPPSTVVWDGRNNDGIMQPDDNNYEATLFYVKNDCFEIGGYSTGGASYVDIKNFDLKSKYSVFNINMINTSGTTVITGLANVHQMNIKIYAATGQYITEFDITNPRSSIAISKQSLSAKTGIAEVADAFYTVRVYVINNCNRSSVFVKNSCLIGDQLENQGAAYDEMFDYASIAKNSIFQCPYEAFYNQNLLAPMNCCEGNLYLNNVDIWTSWLVNIKGDIYIGSNTTFEEGSVNVLHAGEQIILDPTDQTITINNQTTILKPNTFECEICKMYEITANEDNENNRELVNLNDTSTSIIQDFVVYPNPFSSGEITINSNISRINIKNLKLELTNSVGVPIPIIITSKNARMIKFKLTQKPASGIYYIYYVSDDIEKTFPLVIQD